MTTTPTIISYSKEDQELSQLSLAGAPVRSKPKKQALQMVVTGGNIYKGEWKGDKFVGKSDRKDKEQTGTWVNGAFVTDTVTVEQEQPHSRQKQSLRSRLNNLKKHLAH
mmetsp:Transcript_14225/g.20014  ORF Transcript_14225/g.20014 Transcript_14225/m.20014 type:complete len:109 (+) Transcript_14225:134-460(+)